MQAVKAGEQRQSIEPQVPPLSGGPDAGIPPNASLVLLDSGLSLPLSLFWPPFDSVLSLPPPPKKTVPPHPPLTLIEATPMSDCQRCLRRSGALKERRSRE